MRRFWRDRSLRTKSLALIALPLIPLLVSSALFADSAKRARLAQASVSRTLQVKAQSATLLGAIVDSETGVRGYLLTRSDEALQIYRNAEADIESAFLTLATLVADDAEQVEHLRAIAALSAARPMDALLDYGRATGLGTPAPVDLLMRSRATMNALRAKFDELQASEDRRLQSQTAAAGYAQRRTTWLVVLGATVGVFGGVLAAVMFSAGIASRVGRVGDNAARLARGEPLEPLPPAADEVGYVSRQLDEAHTLLAQRITELQATRDELDHFFSLSLDMLSIVGPNGHFTRLNPAWQQTLGWTDEELCARPYLDFVHPDDVASTIAAGQQLAEGSPVINFENRYRCRDGSYRWLHWRAAPALSTGMVYASAHDVTEQRNAAQELEARSAATAAANQELEAFSYSVSHDLRAPLRHITGFAALLTRKAGSSLDGEGRRYLDTIESSARKMGQLIDDLLAFSRMGRAPLHKRRVRLDELVREAQRETTEGLADRKVTWRLGALPEVEADPALLRLALVNLLSNALKYTSGCPEALVEVDANSNENGETIVFVRDNGVGFDMAYVDKLFGVFQRLHNSTEFEGTGIGLANVRRIVQRHGGRTWAEGTVNGGATFYFSLPTEVHDA